MCQKINFDPRTPLTFMTNHLNAASCVVQVRYKPMYCSPPINDIIACSAYPVGKGLTIFLFYKGNENIRNIIKIIILIIKKNNRVQFDRYN